MGALANDSHEQIALLLAEVLGPIRNELRAEAERLRADVLQLRGEIERVERTALSTGFQGTWRSDTEFAKGAICIHDHELWAAVETTTTRPGTSSWRRLQR